MLSVIIITQRGEMTQERDVRVTLYYRAKQSNILFNVEGSQLFVKSLKQRTSNKACVKPVSLPEFCIGIVLLAEDQILAPMPGSYQKSGWYPCPPEIRSFNMAFAR